MEVVSHFLFEGLIGLYSFLLIRRHNVSNLKLTIAICPLWPTTFLGVEYEAKVIECSGQKRHLWYADKSHNKSNNYKWDSQDECWSSSNSRFTILEYSIPKSSPYHDDDDLTEWETGDDDVFVLDLDGNLILQEQGKLWMEILSIYVSMYRE